MEMKHYTRGSEYEICDSSGWLGEHTNQQFVTGKPVTPIRTMDQSEKFAGCTKIPEILRKDT